MTGGSGFGADSSVLVPGGIVLIPGGIVLVPVGIVLIPGCIALVPGCIGGDLVILRRALPAL